MKVRMKVRDTFLRAGALKFLTLFSCLLFLSASWNFENDQEKVEFLLAIEDEYPDFFLQNIKENFKRDYFEIFDRVKEVKSQLQSDPGISTLLANKNPDLMIIKPKENEGSIGGQQTKGPDQLTKDLFLKIDEISKTPSAQDFMTAMIKTIPQDLKAQAFVLKDDQQLEFVKKHLPDDLIKNGFNPSVFNFHAPNISKEDILKEFNKRVEIEKDIVAKLQAIQKTNDRDLLFLSKHKNAKYFLKKADIKPPTTPASKDSQNSSLKIILKEVSPEVGVLRGCAGGDCSTKESFAYALNPYDKIFFITDGDNNLKGYLAVTKTIINQKPALYLHTITGPKLSAIDVKEAITALYSIKDQMPADFSFEKVYIPNSNQLKTNINFVHIRDALDGMTNKKQTAPNSIVFLDENIRKILKNQTNSTYDDPKNNQFPQEVEEVNSVKTFNLSFTQKKIPTLDENSKKLKALKFALRLYQNKKQDLALKFGEVFFSNNFLNNLFLLTNNESRLPVKTYLKELNDLLKKENILLDLNNSRDDSLPLKMGLINSSDAFLKENLESTRKLLLSTKDWTPYWESITPVLKINQDEKLLLHALKLTRTKDKDQALLAFKNVLEISPNNDKILAQIKEMLTNKDVDQMFLVQALDSLSLDNKVSTYKKEILMQALSLKNRDLKLAALRSLQKQSLTISEIKKILDHLYHSDQDVRRQAARTIESLKAFPDELIRELFVISNSITDDYVKGFINRKLPAPSSDCLTQVLQSLSLTK